MIISCNNCNKKFEIESNLIPEKGRLLQCSVCQHKWFFKKKIINDSIEQVKSTKSNFDEDLSVNKIIQPDERDFKSVESNNIEQLANEKEKPKEKVITTEGIQLLDKSIKNDFKIERITIDDASKNEKDHTYNKIKSLKNKSNYNILGLTTVFIITFIAFIIFLDTLKTPISKFIPNIEFLLYSLYETINDILLFFKDLI
jgi:predicted Zn finger-like uncharacterized protein